MSYVYRELEDPETDIRVAVLHPGSFEDEIRISFRTRRLKKVLVQPVRTGRPYLSNNQANGGRLKISTKRYRTLGA
jgi:hypothetical protein